MPEYIEREVAFNALLKLIPKVDDDGYCWVIRGDAATAVDSIPAADVRPVVRAHWKPGDIRNVTAVCSNCGRLRLGNGAEWATKLAYFCEKCGADMRPEPPKEE